MTGEKATPYLDEHHPDHPDQPKHVDGVPINPNLRSDFDDTPNDERDPLEVSHWWDRPFIVTESWEDNSESWESYSERFKQFPSVNQMTKEEFEEDKEKGKQSWFDTFPTGLRYSVRCLNGGAWDRSTLWGIVGSLDEAMEIIEDRSL